jgi:hypothetical protein
MIVHKIFYAFKRCVLIFGQFGVGDHPQSQAVVVEYGVTTIVHTCVEM